MPKKILTKTKKNKVIKNTKGQKELIAFRTDALMTIRGYLPTIAKHLDNCINHSMMKGSQWSAYNEQDIHYAMEKMKVLLKNVSRQFKTADFPRLKDLPGSDYEEDDNGE